MRKLSKTIVATLVAATALGTALPAQAQPYPDRHDDRRWDDRRGDDRRWDDRRGDDRRWDDRHDRGRAQAISAQINELHQRVQRLDRRDRISEREAAALRRDVYQLRQQFQVYNRNGLSQREARYLQDRIQNIRHRLRLERRDNDGRRW